MKISIYRLDYKNPTPSNGYYALPNLSNINDITDVNEVKSIYAYFKTKEEAETTKPFSLNLITLN